MDRFPAIAHGKRRMSFADYAKLMTNGELAASLEFNAPHAKSDTARAVMQEAARRLRCEPEMVFAENPPTLKAYAIPDE